MVMWSGAWLMVCRNRNETDPLVGLRVAESRLSQQLVELSRLDRGHKSLGTIEISNPRLLDACQFYIDTG